MEGNKSVFITGSSTGIGRASALRLDKEGFQVFAGVRKSSDGDALKNASSGKLIPVILDVTESESIAKAVKTVSEETNGELYGLMNNAGVPGGGPVELVPIPAIRNVFEVNVISVFAVTQAFLPLLRKSRGRVVNTGSAFGLTALPGRSVYSASKFAVEAISESLRVELHPFGISVSVIEPGAIATEIWKKITAKSEELILNANPDIYKLYASLMLFYKNKFENQKYLPSEAVADRAYHAFTVKKPKYHYVVGSDAKFLAFIEHLPERIRDWIIYKIMYKEVELPQSWSGKEHRTEVRNKVASRVKPGSDKLIFTPWLNGERTPVDSTTLRGSFYNISLSTTADHFARAVLEGVAYNTRWSLKYVERFIGRRMDTINIIGGGAISSLWCQIFANVFDRRIRQVKDPIESNARGAAFIASAGLGFINFEDIPNLIKYENVYDPDAKKKGIYDELFNEFVNI